MLEAPQGIGQTDFHAHHAIQITLSLEGGFELGTANERLSGPAVAVASDASHILRATGIAALLFVDPESPQGRALAAGFRGGALIRLDAPALPELMAALAAAFRAGCAEAELIRHGQNILEALAGGQDMPAPDRRVAAMLAYAEAGLDNALLLAGAASAACLSPSRARHLFAEQTGLPFKTFVLWLRIRRAVEIYASGASLTDAAHEAGFADSAHLSRTFRRTFGLPATALRLNEGATPAATSSRTSPGVSRHAVGDP